MFVGRQLCGRPVPAVHERHLVPVAVRLAPSGLRLRSRLSYAERAVMPPDPTLEDRISRLEDTEAISRLKARYCYWSDRGYAAAGDNPGEVAALFTDDGAWGDTQGADAIRGLFEGFQRRLPFALHLALAPTIELDRDRASGTWYGLIQLTTDDGEHRWTGGIYSDQFVRTPSGWRFQQLRFTEAFTRPS
jgi:hypothetical protein